ncbi:hypothetical protein D3C75_1109270 [compost metagenome]
MQHIFMAAVFQLGAGLEQRINAFCRNKAGYGYQLRDVVVMRHRLESFLIKTVRNDADITGMIDIWRQILGERAGYGHQTVTH